MNQDTPLQVGGLPQWLIPEDKDVPATTDIHSSELPDLSRHSQLVVETRKAKNQLELMAYEAVFDRALEEIAAGQPLSAVIEADHRSLSYQRFLSWVHRDEERKAKYYQAQEVGAEVVFEQMLEIADADDSLEDVARSTLRINTRKWRLAILNRKRFGEVKQIEQNVTIDLGAAMQEARDRVNARVIDVKARVING